ncbi:MAG: hypothetical protein GY948_05590 [Alphaproteobacteria bacterium]|nr:hypothetical protein [Alphaproteobacteria bacterium]
MSGHVRSCKRFAAFFKACPSTATPENIRRFQHHLDKSDLSILTRNQIMTGVKFLYRVTLRRPDLIAKIFYVRAPKKFPLVMSREQPGLRLAFAPISPKQIQHERRQQGITVPAPR